MVAKVANRKGGDTGMGEVQPGNNSAALGQGPCSTSRDTHNNVFRLFKMSAFFILEKDHLNLH